MKKEFTKLLAGGISIACMATTVYGEIVPTAINENTIEISKRK